MEHMGLIFLGGVFVSESKTANTSWCAIFWFLLNWLSVYSAVPTKQSSTTKHFCNLYQPYYPYHPCMVYSPTFTITIKQMYVNIPYMDPMGYRIHLELQQKCPSKWRRGVYIECARVDPLLILGNINRESENPFIGLYKLLLLGWWPSPIIWINNGSLDLTIAQMSGCEICPGLRWWDHDTISVVQHGHVKKNIKCSSQIIFNNHYSSLYTTQPNARDVHAHAYTPNVYATWRIIPWLGYVVNNHV